MKHILYTTLFVMLAATDVFADSGVCTGKTQTGVAVSVRYFTNGYSDDNIDYFAKFQVGTSEETTYEMYITEDGLSGNPTKKSLRLGRDLGIAKLSFSPDKLMVRGSIGKENFANLKCSYRPN